MSCRLYHQIRYGCRNPACKVPTCRSCRDRLANNVPYRVPTPLTARAIASFLVSLDNPYRHLCLDDPRPKTDVHDLAFPTSRVLQALLSAKESGSFLQDEHLPYWLSHRSHLPEWAARASKDEQNLSLKSMLVFDERSQDRLELPAEKSLDTIKSHDDRILSMPIDPKSFSQKLFNTASWKLSAFVEVRNGRYRLPSLENDKRLSLKETLAYWEVHFHEHNRQIQRKQPSLHIHPVIGVFLYPYLTVTENLDLASTMVSMFGRSVYESYQQNDGRRLLGALGRTCPFKNKHRCEGAGTSISKREAMLRLVQDVLESPKGLQTYGVDLRNRPDTPDGQSRTLSPIFLVQEFHTLFLLGQHPQFILTCLLKSVSATHANSQFGSTCPDDVAAHVVNVIFGALIALVQMGHQGFDTESWQEFVQCRQQGCCLPIKLANSTTRKTVVQYLAAYQNTLAINLVTTALRSVASRNYAHSIVSQHSLGTTDSLRHLHTIRTDYLDRIFHFLKPGPSLRRVWDIKILLEWVRTTFLENWDGRAKFSWSSDVGCAIDFMGLLCE